jgi:DNA-directed RNA polymerase specialized sigma24 family protein
MPDLTPDIAAAVDDWRNHSQRIGDTKLDVGAALSHLPAPNRRLVVLRFFEGCTWAECAEEMSKGRAHKMTPEQARSMFRTTAAAMRRILTGKPKRIPAKTRAHLDKDAKK